MRRFVKIVIAAVLVLLGMAGLTMWLLYSAVKADVPEYRALLGRDTLELDARVAEFESRLAALYSDTQSLDEWSGRFTAEQVNAWLAVRLDELFPGYATAGVRAPRCWIDGEEITLAAESRVGAFEGIVTVAVQPFVTDNHELALEIDRAKLGRLELPLEQFGEHLRRTPLDESAPLRWSRTGGELIAVVEPGRIDIGEGRRLRFVGIDLREGELLIRGAVEALNDANP